jgi:hypothetical protein
MWMYWGMSDLQTHWRDGIVANQDINEEKDSQNMQRQDLLDIAKDASLLEEAARALGLRCRALTAQSNTPTPDQAPPRGASTALVRAPSPGPVRPAPRSEVAIVKIGRSAGVPITEADSETLSWYAAVLERTLLDPAKAKWRENDKVTLATVRAELAARAAR